MLVSLPPSKSKTHLQPYARSRVTFPPTAGRAAASGSPEEILKGPPRSNRSGMHWPIPPERNSPALPPPPPSPAGRSGRGPGRAWRWILLITIDSSSGKVSCFYLVLPEAEAALACWMRKSATSDADTKARVVTMSFIFRLCITSSH